MENGQQVNFISYTNKGEVRSTGVISNCIEADHFDGERFGSFEIVDDETGEVMIADERDVWPIKA